MWERKGKGGREREGFACSLENIDKKIEYPKLRNISYSEM